MAERANSKSFNALFTESKPVVNEKKTSNFNSLFENAPASLREENDSWGCGYESGLDSGTEFTTQGVNNRTSLNTSIPSKPVFGNVVFKLDGDHGFQGSVLYINGVGKDTTASGPINTKIKRKSANQRNTPADFSSYPKEAVNDFNNRVKENKLDVSFSSSGKPFLNFPPGMNTQEIINVVDALTAFAQTWVYPSSLSVVDQRHVVAAIPDATSATNFPVISNSKTTGVNYSVVAKGGNHVPSTPAIQDNARTQYEAALKLVESRDSLEKQLAEVLKTEEKLPELKAAADEEDYLAKREKELDEQMNELKQKQKALQAKKSNKIF
jgi:hypothetical protein